MSVKIAPLRELQSASVVRTFEWFLFSVRPDMVEKLVEVVDNHAAAFFLTVEPVSAFEESMVLLLLVQTPQIVEQVVSERRDDILEAEPRRVKAAAVDDSNLVRGRNLIL